MPKARSFEEWQATLSTPTLLAAINNALLHGSDMNSANLAFEVLCYRLAVDRDTLEFDPHWTQKEPQ